jgi:hypothetical protein
MTAPEHVAVLRTPFLRTARIRRRDAAEGDERLDVLLALGDVHDMLGVGREHLGESVQHEAHGEHLAMHPSARGLGARRVGGLEGAETPHPHVVERRAVLAERGRIVGAPARAALPKCLRLLAHHLEEHRALLVAVGVHGGMPPALPRHPACVWPRRWCDRRRPIVPLPAPALSGESMHIGATLRMRERSPACSTRMQCTQRPSSERNPQHRCPIPRGSGSQPPQMGQRRSRVKRIMRLSVAGRTAAAWSARG